MNQEIIEVECPKCGGPARKVRHYLHGDDKDQRVIEFYHVGGNFIVPAPETEANPELLAEYYRRTQPAHFKRRWRTFRRRWHTFLEALRS